MKGTALPCALALAAFVAYLLAHVVVWAQRGFAVVGL